MDQIKDNIRIPQCIALRKGGSEKQTAELIQTISPYKDASQASLTNKGHQRYSDLRRLHSTKKLSFVFSTALRHLLG